MYGAGCRKVGYRVQGVWCRVQECRVQGVWCRVQECKVQGLRFAILEQNGFMNIKGSGLTNTKHQ